MANRDDLEPSSIDFEKMGKRRHLWIIVAAAALVVVGVIAFIAFRMIEREQREALVKAWSELNVCLLGNPLADGEEASTRVRNIQLTVMGIPPLKRAKFGEHAWPASCGNRAHAVAEVLRGQGSDAALAQSAEKLARQLKEEKGFVADLSGFVDAAWRDAIALELPVVPASDVEPPPAAMMPLNEGTLPKTSRLMTGTFSLANLRPALHPEPTLRLLVDDPDVPGGPAHCWTTQQEAKLHCAYVPGPAAKLSPGLRLWGTNDDGAEPLFFVGDRGTAGIHSAATGKQVAATLTYGSTSRKDGSVELLTWSDEAEEVRWVHVAADGTPSETPLLARKDIGNPYYTVTMLWGWVTYKAYVDGADGLRFLARQLPPEGSPPDAVDAGKVWEHVETHAYEDQSHITGCRTDKAIIARVAGTTRDSITFLIDGKWTTPVPAEQAGGTLTCRNAEATTTRTRHFMSKNRNLATVTQSRCNVSSCSGAAVSFAKLLEGVEELGAPDTKTLQAVDIDGKLTLIWQAGENGGLRMRMAPADTMTAAKDQVIYDDLVHAGGARGISTLLAFEVIPADRFALVVLRTMNEGVHVLRINADGSVRPVAVELKE